MEGQIKTGRVTFTAQRYTAEQWAEYSRDDLTLAEICRRHVTGWAGVTEKDIYGEGDKVVSFDKPLFDEIIAERVDWASKIVTDMGKAYTDFYNRCTDAIKK